MAYTTPRFDAGLAQSQLSTQKALTDSAADFGRFMGQQRHRRTTEEMGRGFSQNMPKVGRSFNARGMWNSGLRREGQRNFANDFGRAMGRVNEDQAAGEQQFIREQGLRDASYQQALLQIQEMVDKARAAGVDPFAAIRGGV